MSSYSSRRSGAIKHFPSLSICWAPLDCSGMSPQIRLKPACPPGARCCTEVWGESVRTLLPACLRHLLSLEHMNRIGHEGTPVPWLFVCASVMNVLTGTQAPRMHLLIGRGWTECPTEATCCGISRSRIGILWIWTSLFVDFFPIVIC